jgi:hypothetical protein
MEAAMSIFFLAGLIAYVLDSFVSVTNLNEHIKSKIPWLMALAAAGLVAVLILVLVAVESGSREYPIYEHVRKAALAPETAQAILGFISGAICRKFPLWAATDNAVGSESGSWRVPTTIVVIAALVALALFAPGGSAIVDRITGFETPVVKLQLATSASDRQLAASVDRDLSLLDDISDLSGSLRFLQYDCGYAILSSGGPDQLDSENRQNFAKYTDFKNAIAFRKSSDFAKFVRRITIAKGTGADVEILKAHVRPVAEKLSRLAATLERNDQDAFDQAYADAEVELKRQDDAVRIDNKIDDNRVGDDLSEDDQRDDLRWCGTGDDEITTVNLRDVVNYTRAFYGFVAGLDGFVGDLDGQILMYSLAKSRPLLKEDINVNLGLAGSLYYGGRQIGEIFPYVLTALQRLEHEADVARNRSNVDGKIAEELGRRYERGRIILHRQLAYLWALESLRPQEKIRPEEDAPLDLADRYAREAYDGPKEAVRILCEDDDSMIYAEDTYALVKLAIQANNVRTHAAGLDREELRKAQSLLEDARAQLSLAGREAKSCINQQRAAAWTKRIYSHLRLVESLRR